jgi:hypothetical protein
MVTKLKAKKCLVLERGDCTKIIYRLTSLSGTMEENSFPKKFKLALSLILIVGALAFYYAWGIMYNSWNIFNGSNMGVYSIVVVMLGFGILGLFLTRAKN